MGKKGPEQKKKPQALRIPNRASEEPKEQESTKKDTCGIQVGGRENKFYSGLNKHPRVKNAYHGPLQDNMDIYLP